MHRTVMVVDNDRDIIDLTRMILEGSGYRVMSAASGSDALRLLEENHPDLIILDINMPEMDGWQVLRMLKIDKRTSGIPVAMFSIKSEVRDRLQGMQDGALDYITKPFSCDELVDRVHAIFDSLGADERATS